MSGSRDSQQPLAAGQDQVDAERERVRALGEFVQNALRQLRSDHSFFGNINTLEMMPVTQSYAGLNVHRQ